MTLNPLWIAVGAIVVLLIWDIFGKGKLQPKAWLVAGICFVLGMSVFGFYFLQSRKTDDSLHVVGYATKMFESDLAKWTLRVQKNTDLDGLMDGYKTLNSDVNAFRELLLEQGFAEKDINIQPPTSSPTYDSYGSITGYSVDQMIYLLSSDVKKVEEVALDPDFFAERGLVLNQSSLEYLYSKLAELKKEMIGAATSDAYDRAKEIVGASKARLGRLTAARTGVFQITEPYSTDVSDYGYYQTNTRLKSISITVTADFEL